MQAIRRRFWLKMSAATLLGRAAQASAPMQRAAMHTRLGVIVLALDTVHAPASAGAFLAAIDAGAYTGGRFTRVVRPDNDHGDPKISVVQGAARLGGPTLPSVPHETTRQTGLRHLDGTLSLPRDAVGSATGAEFFICVGDQPGLDFGATRNHDGQGFAAFGRVAHGMEIVRKIWRMDARGNSPDSYTQGQMLRVPVPILGISRLD